jgi:hypothetical protein
MRKKDFPSTFFPSPIHVAFVTHQRTLSQMLSVCPANVIYVPGVCASLRDVDRVMLVTEQRLVDSVEMAGC